MDDRKAAVLAYKCEPEHRESIVNALATQYDLYFHNDANTFQSEVSRKPFDVILLNLQHENGRKNQLLGKIQEHTPSTPVIITCESEDSLNIDKTFEPIIFDVLNHPLSPGRIKRSVRHALEKRRQDNELAYLRRTQDIVYSFDRIIADSDSFKSIINSLRKFACTDATILITGATGTGKSFLSGTVHYNSPRHAKPFIKINCANIPETLLESELFGHERGSFTGADKQRIGRFEQADGGTIFLDEIGEIPLEIQSKLLRVLEDKSFERVGGNKTIKVDVRLIAATSRELKADIAAGRFREDLYYRLHVFPISLPPLRFRTDDIPQLVHFFLDKYGRKLNKHFVSVTEETMQALARYHWPGNVRELEHIIERGVILCQDPEFRLVDPSLEPQMTTMHSASLVELNTVTRAHVLQVLQNTNWRIEGKGGAAETLGLHPSTLRFRIKKLGIQRP